MLSILQAKEELGMASSEATETIDPVPRRITQKQHVVVVGDSLVHGTEASICQPDHLSRELCCLLGA